jgi:L-proline---[L-prolyl-carrier protein] ligase
VTLDYWTRHEQTDEAFDIDDRGRRWYKTGDVVQDTGGRNRRFVGPRARMVTRRGHRVELAETESAPYPHPNTFEAATVAVPDETNAVLVTAFLTWSAEGTPSIIDLKRFCDDNLPLEMVPDRFNPLSELLKMSTDKIDSQEPVRHG